MIEEKDIDYVVKTHYGDRGDGINIPALCPVPVGSLTSLKLREKGLECEVVDKKPMLHRKKYYVGCVKEGDEVIIRRHGGIGDVIWTLPVARMLKERFKCDITYCVMDKDRVLFENLPYKLTKGNQISIEDAGLCDWILDYFYSVEGYAQAAYLDPYDISCRWAFGFTPNDFDMMNTLVLSDTEKAYGEAYKGFIVVNGQSSSPKRSYPYEEALIDLLLKDGYKVALIGSRQQILKEREGFVNFTGKTTLRQMLSIVYNCAGIITADSGALHIAGQWGKRGVAMFSTVKSKTRIKYYTSIKAIDTPRFCGGCLQLAEGCPIDGECMSLITPDRVYKEFKEWHSIQA